MSVKKVFFGLGLLIASLPVLAEWYSGGSLHRATAAQWISATPENRLATSADFSAKAKKPKNMRELKADAINLNACITTAASDPSLSSIKVSELAAGCIVLMR